MNSTSARQLTGEKTNIQYLLSLLVPVHKPNFACLKRNDSARRLRGVSHTCDSNISKVYDAFRILSLVEDMDVI